MFWTPRSAPCTQVIVKHRSFKQENSCFTRAVIFFVEFITFYCLLLRYCFFFRRRKKVWLVLCWDLTVRYCNILYFLNEIFLVLGQSLVCPSAFEKNPSQGYIMQQASLKNFPYNKQLTYVTGHSLFETLSIFLTDLNIRYISLWFCL